MSRRRAVLLVSGLLLAAVVVLGLLVGWRALQVNDALQQAVRDAEALRSSLETGEQDEIDSDLSALQDSASEADELTSGTTWSLVTRLPWVGDDARGVRAVAGVVDALSAEGIPPLAAVATDLDRLVPQDGRIDIGAVESLAAPVAAADAALSAARDDLRREDPSGFVARLRSEYRELQGLVDDAAGAMDAADVAVGMLPELLGSEERREFLLVFQNNAELRATGGLPGAMSLIATEGGRIDLARQDSAAAFGERESPVLPLTPEEKDIFSDQLGTFVQDANFTPDWPRAAQLIRARWEERHPADDLDGVFTLDTVAVSYLLAATGPIEVGGYTITSDNAVSLLLNQVYLDIEDSTLQDEFFADVASTVFDAVSSGQVQRPRELLRALVRAGSEGRLNVNFTDDDEQEQIDSRRIAGTMDAGAPDAGAIDVTLLDGTGSKMSYYLDYRAEADVLRCTSDGADVRVRARLVSDPPPNPETLPVYVTGGANTSTKPGNQLVQVRLFAPPESQLTGFTIRGREYGTDKRYLDGRQVSTAYLLMEPGKPADVEWSMSVPGRWSTLPVRVTPGVDPIDYSSELVRAC